MMKNQSMNVQLHEGQEIPVTIKRIGINGEGIGYFKRKAVFIPGTLPGEEVVASVEKDHPNYVEARVRRIRKQSKDRIDPPWSRLRKMRRLSASASPL